MIPEVLSDSARKRLPQAIQKLSEKEQMTFILLRMKRDAAYISRELKVTLDKAREMIRAVQDELVKSGSLDLIQDPVFYPIDQPVGDDERPGPGFQLASEDMDMADQIAMSRFYKTLGESLDKMPKEGRRLLSLWFNKDMRAKDILNFYKGLSLPLTDSKPISTTSEQDVFYALEKNIRNLLTIVRTNMSGEGQSLTLAMLKEILDETGV
ncbi:MAG: hypothetical protein HZB29_10905 [Nitrospinae bacterium]|nr:hypothetical protein [Nitrospinota bacterium]